MSRVAVVDDNSDNRLIIRTILEDQYEIEEFATGTEAIQAFRQRRPDVVILDEIPHSFVGGVLGLRRVRARIFATSAPTSVAWWGRMLTFTTGSAAGVE